jgi:coenzyme F420-0:L-glutamate ligase/coenzyme F420-1:gamma-L-glutamate ligase
MTTQQDGPVLCAFGLAGIPLISPGDDLAAFILTALQTSRLEVQQDDVLVIAQKVVSKAEGNVVSLSSVVASPAAIELARLTSRDARLCQLYLDESREVVAVRGRHVVTIHRLGFRGTGAGVDLSNAAPLPTGTAVLLPRDPDASARRLRQRISSATGKRIAVIVSDSFGSPFREGAFGAAIGLAGISAVERPGGEDLGGRPSSPVINRVDEIASVASILMGQTNASSPVILVRGATYTVDESARIQDLLVDGA